MFTLRLLGTPSLENADGPVTGRAALRQRIAVLALLAVEHPRPLSRDKLVADLWPESDTGDARHLLRESLYILRSALGEDAVLGTGDDLRLNPDRLTCDLWEFEAALAREDPERAVSVYGGPFLNGFHLSESEEFGQWMDGERTRLARRYSQALEQVAERAMRDGNPLRAAEWWSRLAAAEPYNSRIALRYMQALEAAGDRASALRHASAHSELLRADLDAAPEPEVVALAERLKRESRIPLPGVSSPDPPRAMVSASPDTDAEEQSPEPPAAERGRGTHGRWAVPVVLAAAAVVGLGVLGGTLSRARTPPLASQRVAAAPFENRTGRPDLDDLGNLAADWIIRGAMETPMLGPAALEAVYSPPADRPADAIALAGQVGAEKVIRGSYYLSGDSVLFQAGVLDVASGRVLRSFDPVGARIDRAIDALEALRERIAVGLSPLFNELSRGTPVDPDLVHQPSLAAYRAFLAGREHSHGDWGTAIQHYRRAAALDSTFVAPLIQIAYIGTWFWDETCSLPDSIGAVLEPRRDRMAAWDRLTIDLLLAYCSGETADALRLLGERLEAYPRSSVARVQYAMALQSADQPRAARRILLDMDPERDLMWELSPSEVWPRYWSRLADTWHMTGEYRTELAITDRWRDSTASEWWEVRGRALAALGLETELRELLAGTDGTLETFASDWLMIAKELAAHGHQQTTATAMAESILTRLEPEPDTGWVPGSLIEVSRLLGRTQQERRALERLARTDLDSLDGLEVRARLAVLSADTAEAERLDSALARWSTLPLMAPRLRAGLFFARAGIAAGLGQRERAVDILREPGAYVSAHEHHADPLLAPLRGYPPFEAWLRPDR
jgi:DNA-binding SARP family transcriptional activator